MAQSTELLRPNEKYPSEVYYRKQRGRVTQLPPHHPPWSMQEELGASQSFPEDLDLRRFRCHLNRNELASRMFGSKVLVCC